MDFRMCWSATVSYTHLDVYKRQEYHITIQDEDFNLGILTMRTPEGVFEADFDA